jgi:hypothetical protein
MMNLRLLTTYLHHEKKHHNNSRTYLEKMMQEWMPNFRRSEFPGMVQIVLALHLQAVRMSLFQLIEQLANPHVFAHVEQGHTVVAVLNMTLLF